MEKARSPLTRGLIKNLKSCRLAGSRGPDCNVWIFSGDSLRLRKKGGEGKVGEGGSRWLKRSS